MYTINYFLKTVYECYGAKTTNIDVRIFFYESKPTFPHPY